MVIQWEASQDPDFESYRLIQSRGTKDDPDTIFVTSDVEKTKFILNIFDPKIENWFWVDVKNSTGLRSSGPKKSHSLETQSPTSPILKLLKENMIYKFSGR